MNTINNGVQSKPFTLSAEASEFQFTHKTSLFPSADTNNNNDDRYNIEAYPDIDALHTFDTSDKNDIQSHILSITTHNHVDHNNNSTTNSNNKRPRPSSSSTSFSTTHPLESLPLPALLSHGLRAETVTQLMDMRGYLRDYVSNTLLFGVVTIWRIIYVQVLIHAYVGRLCVIFNSNFVSWI